jgi:exopolyphosphatase/pppGpp-phosphohydrolase
LGFGFKIILDQASQGLVFHTKVKHGGLEQQVVPTLLIFLLAQVQQLLALRLAVILCHARRDPDLSGLHIHYDVEKRTASLQIEGDWAELWPQSAQLLREEKNAGQKPDWAFQVEVS